MKKIIGIIVCLMLFILCTGYTSNVLINKRNLVVDYVNKVNLLDSHKVAENLCEPKVTAFFLHNVENPLALISDTTFYDSSGFSWCVIQIGCDDRGGNTFKIGDCACLWCREFELFVVQIEGMLNRFLALNVEIDVDEIEENISIGKKFYCGDVVVSSMGQSRKFVSAIELNDIVTNPSFRRIERAQAEVYTGFDMKRLSSNKENEIPDKENLPNGGLIAPVNFKTFAQSYRNEVKQRLGLKKPVTVYVVFFDADLDGDADCYVSSDAEMAADGRYPWTLYLGKENTFKKATDRVWINRGTIHDVAMLEPQDVAPTNAFYRVVRTYGSPQILVMESDGKCLHTHAYTHLLSEEDRRKRPPENRHLLKEGEQTFDDWSGEMKTKYGFDPPKDFRDQISWLCFHHLERLPCLEYPDEE